MHSSRILKVQNLEDA